MQQQSCQQQSFCLANIVSVLHQTRLAFKKQSKHHLYQNYSVCRKAVKIQIQIINQWIMLKCNPISTFRTLFTWFQTKIPLRVAPAFGSVHSGRNPGDREGAWTSDPGQQWQMQHWWGGAPAYIWPVVYKWKKAGSHWSQVQRVIVRVTLTETQRLLFGKNQAFVGIMDELSDHYQII